MVDHTAATASVVIPAFNHERYVEEAVQSVLDQTYPGVELIVVDDASHDRTWEIVQRLADRHGFTFIRNERNLGLNATLERGLARSSGDYVSILASDDAILPHKIARQVEYLQSTGKDGVYANGLYLRDDGSRAPIDLAGVARRFRDRTILRYIYTQDTHAPLLQSALIRRDALLALWPVRSQFRSDDWVTLIKLIEGYEVGFIDEPLFLYRQHEANTHRDYRATFPMRLQVIEGAVPPRYRAEAMANLLSSQASYLRKDGNFGEALGLALNSARMNPSPMRLLRHIARRLGAARRKAHRLIQG
jgi:alpha-1,3-rhamnosyltransferase